MKTVVRIERKITIRIERAELEKLLREAVKAPANATVDFDGTYLDNVYVSWSEYQEDEVQP